jgi:hypothetical protein
VPSFPRNGGEARDRQPPAAVSDEHRDHPYDEGDQRSRGRTTGRAQHRGTDHDDAQPGSRDGSQHPPETDQSWKDETQGAQDFGDADEVDEWDRQRRLPREVCRGHDQLHSPGEEEERREQQLKDPEHLVDLLHGRHSSLEFLE